MWWRKAAAVGAFGALVISGAAQVDVLGGESKALIGAALDLVVADANARPGDGRPRGRVERIKIKGSSGSGGTGGSTGGTGGSTGGTGGSTGGTGGGSTIGGGCR